MSTIVLPNPEQTPMQTPADATQPGYTPAENNNANKRSLDADNSTVPNKKQETKTTRSVAPRFIASRYNWKINEPNIDVGKDRDGNPEVQLHNASHQYNYQVHAPPGTCKFVHLGKGGNHGKVQWAQEEKGAIVGFVYTNAPLEMKSGETVEQFNARNNHFKQQQDEFHAFLKKTHEDTFKAMYDNMPAIKDQFVKKARAVLPKDSTDDKIEAMAVKLFNSYCVKHTPMKEDGQGGVEFNIKCGAYIDNKNGTYTPRDVYVFDGNGGYTEHQTITGEDIKDGAIISPVFSIRTYTTPGYKSFGITYQLENRFIILHKNGSGRVGGTGGGPLRDDQLKQRQYQFKGVTTKSGKYNIYVNDLNGNSYLHRMPASVTKYCDLEQGTLGKFPGVNESSAKFTATFIEDESNKEYFDHIEGLVRDAATHLFNDPKVMKEQKAELRVTAQDVASETGQSVDATMLSLFMENIQSPITNKGNGRELRCNQRMHKYKDSPDDDWVKNTFKYRDEDCDPIDEAPSLEPGCKIAPVLKPEIYVLNTGLAGVKLTIDLNNYIHVASGLSSFQDDGSAPVYNADMF